MYSYIECFAQNFAFLQNMVTPKLKLLQGNTVGVGVEVGAPLHIFCLYHKLLRYISIAKL